MIIDAHCHVGHGRLKDQSAEELVREMDEAGVELAIICPVDEQIVIDNREGNDAMVAACHAHPDRLRGLAVANPWYGERAEAELERALQNGLAGLKVHPSRQGHYINDQMLDPLIQKVEAVQGFVYLHTGTDEYSLPLEAIDLANRFPSVTFILGHYGGVGIYFAHCHEVLRTCPNTLVETSHLAFTIFLTQGIEEFGESRFVFGSDSPVGSMELEKWKLEKMQIKGISAILGGNVECLLQQRGVL